jgi:pimeloyl-ACP methyl ester carboxylesterase
LETLANALSHRFQESLMAVGRSRRAVVAAALSFAVLALTPCAADAACPRLARCSTLTVPLDHSGATPGTLSIAYATVPATGARNGTIVFLSGGPGQAAIPLTASVAEVLRPLRSSYDLVTVDQRGTGGSGAVDCSVGGVDDVAGCAAKLGERRAFWSTPETAQDLEDLRRALGVDKLTLYGVSYGTKVASEYARRYPASTAALVLDSPVPVDGLDGYDQLRALGTPRVLAEVCHPGPCAATVRDPEAALTAAVERLQDGAVRGPLVSPTGKITSARVTEALLYSFLSQSDIQPALRAGLPAATASLAEGDAAPLLHLSSSLSADSGDAAGVNSARLLATSCIEGRLPWAPDSPVASRAGAVQAFLAADADVFAPFSPDTVLSASLVGLCQNWPPTPRPEAVPYLGPDVPVLVLSGRADLRTPLEDARRTALQYPDARVLAVPGVGHSVASSDLSGCAVRGMVSFLRGRAVDRCSRTSAAALLQNLSLPYTPASISDLRPTAASGLAGRTFSAVSVTLAGVGYDTALATSSRFGGLRAGYVTASRSNLSLHGVEWIRGVRVTGTLSSRGTGTLTISGPSAAPGTLTYARTGVTGVLGGKSISARADT